MRRSGWALRELADGWIQNNEREGPHGFYQNARRVLGLISDDTAVLMRSACVKKVKELARERVKQSKPDSKDHEYDQAVAFVLIQLAEEMETLSIQDQK